MAINLKKGQSIVLDKNVYDLSQLTMGLGWDVVKPKGLMANLLGGGQQNIDIDAYAMLISPEGKIKNYKEDVIYYSHLSSADKTVVHTGDNLTGDGEGDDEQIILKLNQISTQYQKIILGVSIYDANKRQQHFGIVENAFVRAVDAKGKEIARFDLSQDAIYQGKISMLMGEVERQNNGWQFRALGEPLTTDLSGVVGSLM